MGGHERDRPAGDTFAASSRQPRLAPLDRHRCTGRALNRRCISSAAGRAWAPRRPSNRRCRSPTGVAQSPATDAATATSPCRPARIGVGEVLADVPRRLAAEQGSATAWATASASLGRRDRGAVERDTAEHERPQRSSRSGGRFEALPDGDRRRHDAVRSRAQRGRPALIMRCRVAATTTPRPPHDSTSRRIVGGMMPARCAAAAAAARNACVSGPRRARRAPAWRARAAGVDLLIVSVTGRRGSHRRLRPHGRRFTAAKTDAWRNGGPASDADHRRLLEPPETGPARFAAGCAAGHAAPGRRRRAARRARHRSPAARAGGHRYVDDARSRAVRTASAHRTAPPLRDQRGATAGTRCRDDDGSGRGRSPGSGAGAGSVGRSSTNCSGDRASSTSRWPPARRRDGVVSSCRRRRRPRPAWPRATRSESVRPSRAVRRGVGDLRTRRGPARSHRIGLRRGVDACGLKPTVRSPASRDGPIKQVDASGTVLARWRRRARPSRHRRRSVPRRCVRRTAPASMPRDAALVDRGWPRRGRRRRPTTARSRRRRLAWARERTRRTRRSASAGLRRPRSRRPVAALVLGVSRSDGHPVSSAKHADAVAHRGEACSAHRPGNIGEHSPTRSGAMGRHGLVAVSACVAGLVATPAGDRQRRLLVVCEVQGSPKRSAEWQPAGGLQARRPCCTGAPSRGSRAEGGRVGRSEGVRLLAVALVRHLGERPSNRVGATTRTGTDGESHRVRRSDGRRPWRAANGRAGATTLAGDGDRERAGAVAGHVGDGRRPPHRAPHSARRRDVDRAQRCVYRRSSGGRTPGPSLGAAAARVGGGASSRHVLRPHGKISPQVRSANREDARGRAVEGVAGARAAARRQPAECARLGGHRFDRNEIVANIVESPQHARAGAGVNRSASRRRHAARLRRAHRLPRTAVDTDLAIADIAAATPSRFSWVDGVTARQPRRAVALLEGAAYPG